MQDGQKWKQWIPWCGKQVTRVPLQSPWDASSASRAIRALCTPCTIASTKRMWSDSAEPFLCVLLLSAKCTAKLSTACGHGTFSPSLVESRNGFNKETLEQMSIWLSHGATCDFSTISVLWLGFAANLERFVAGCYHFLHVLRLKDFSQCFQTPGSLL